MKGAFSVEYSRSVMGGLLKSEQMYVLFHRKSLFPAWTGPRGLTNSRRSLNSWFLWLRPTQRSSLPPHRQPPPTLSYLNIPTSSPQSGRRSSLSVELKKTHNCITLESFPPWSRHPVFQRLRGRTKSLLDYAKPSQSAPIWADKV